MTKVRLRAESLPETASCSYVKVTVDDRLAGNAFACHWGCEGTNVCLVVHRDFWERGLATGRLVQLRQDDDAIYGIMSSHPAACLAAATACGSSCSSTSRSAEEMIPFTASA